MNAPDRFSIPFLFHTFWSVINTYGAVLKRFYREWSRVKRPCFNRKTLGVVAVIAVVPRNRAVIQVRVGFALQTLDVIIVNESCCNGTLKEVNYKYDTRENFLSLHGHF